MQIPDTFEPASFAACLDKMGAATRREAAAVSPSPEGQSLNVFATEFTSSPCHA